MVKLYVYNAINKNIRGVIKRVEVGQLEVMGTLEEEGIDAGLDRMGNKFKDMENQANQANASFNVMGKTSSRLLMTLGGMGVAGVTAMTALATKAPVLAGTMARIEVETLKLSNTLGRQLKPIFDEVAGNLIPSINKAFSDNSNAVGFVVDKVTNLVGALSDLISLDWTSLLENLEKYFNLTSKTPEEITDIQKRLGSFSEFESSVALGQDIWSEFKEGKILSPTVKAVSVQPVIGFIDFIQYLMGANNEKELAFSTANGVPR